MALRATKGDEDARCGRTLSSFLVVCGRLAWRFRCSSLCLQPSGAPQYVAVFCEMVYSAFPAPSRPRRGIGGE
jgi:hypothetical protein